MSMCAYVYVHINAVSAVTEEGYGSPGAGATGGCGLLNMSAENQTLVLCGSSSQSQLLNHLSTMDIPQLFRRPKVYQLKENGHNHIK